MPLGFYTTAIHHRPSPFFFFIARQYAIPTAPVKRTAAQTCLFRGHLPFFYHACPRDANFRWLLKSLARTFEILPLADGDLYLFYISGILFYIIYSEESIFIAECFYE